MALNIHEYMVDMNLIVDLTMKNKIKIPEHDIEISLGELFKRFVNEDRLLKELIRLEVPNIQQLRAEGYNIMSIFIDLLMKNYPLECFTIALNNINASHIDNITWKTIEEAEVYSDNTNMKIAFSLQYNTYIRDLLLQYFYENDNISFILFTLLQSEMIEYNIYEDLLNHIQNDDNYVGKILLKHIKYYCDDDIKMHWFPLIDPNIALVLTN